MTRRPGALIARILLVAAMAGTVIATSGLPPAAASTTQISCTRWQALHVRGTDGQPYVVRNKPSINNNDEGMCISNYASGANFKVVRSPGTAPSAKVRAYPYIGTGCFEGACATANPVTPRAGSLGNYTISWATVQPKNSGVWNSSLDLWLGPRTGEGISEIMIWLNYSKPAYWDKGYPSVWVDGAKWYIVGHDTAAGYHYLSFRRATPTTSATLKIAPFMAIAEQHGSVSPSSLLWASQAGFEIWSGGVGLAITRFSVTY
jgi:hypothetical protein